MIKKNVRVSVRRDGPGYESLGLNDVISANACATHH